MTCMHLSASEAGFETDGSPVYCCDSCGDTWHEDGITEHWEEI